MDPTVFEALSDPNRLAIVELLAERGELCLCHVSQALGISGALASHHVKKLRAAGLVTTVRRGTWLHCALDTAALHEVGARLSALARSAAAPSPCCQARPEQGAVHV